MNYVLLTAAGSGTRMGQDIPKQFMSIDECPVIVYTMQAFQCHPLIDAIAVVCLKGWEVFLKAYASQYGITKLKFVFPGGETNFQSIHNGLKELKNHGATDDDIILIHDGVRPLVSDEIITNSIETCRQYGYAVTGQFCKEVIMEFDDAENTVEYMPIPRERLIRTQTPHTYKLGLILEAQEKAIADGLMNTAASCQLVAQIGVNDQHLVLGTEKNGLKLTNVEDIELFKALKHVSKYPWIK
ncbi:MAG: 2-C-methyl-D-erythritol 4-phosphate cytidylyltransferase [Clostridium sp.]|nr:2-C-methyl-D-erythritol 4-phosphate cytidylyltransferase [Clostridium sp.]